MNIVIYGIGYVGLSNAILLAQNNQVIAIDIIQEKVDMINDKISPLEDNEIKEYLQTKNLNLYATTNPEENLASADFIIISTPTNYNEDKKSFDTSTIEKIIQKCVEEKINGTIVIKSTVPIGFTKSISKKYPMQKILFSPEFLREGKALYDNLYPSRIIVGVDLKNNEIKMQAESFAKLLINGAKKTDIKTLIIDTSEAESVKLFSNSYLALRIAFFNELDSYCEELELNAKNIIDGVCLDQRIGQYYNNPSFGYGGYCLPKDTKQLLSNYKDIPNNIINSIVESNVTRKKHIAQRVINLLKSKEDVVGIYRLIMKLNSDNCKNSSIQDIIEILQKNGINVIIYEPSITTEKFKNITIINDLEMFMEKSNIILANRVDDSLFSVKEKVYTRDIFSRD